MDIMGKNNGNFMIEIFSEIPTSKIFSIFLKIMKIFEPNVV